MVVSSLLLLVSLLLSSAQGFLAPFVYSRVAKAAAAQGAAAASQNVMFHSTAGSGFGEGYPGDDDASLLAIDESLQVDATALAERKDSPGAYHITRPRWYNKNEVAIIVLLVQRLRMLDLKGVEHMLDAQKAFKKQNPRDVWESALFIKAAAPGANFRTVIKRHPRTLLVTVHQMQRVFDIIREAYPNADLARVVERIPSVLSRNATRLEGNIAGLKKYAPEVDSAIFQAAPSMIYLPPHTVEEKVAALRSCLPGVNLYNFLMGMPTALSRSKETVPRGLDQLRERFPTASSKEIVRIVESAPSLVRMSGKNGSLSIRVDHLMALLPGVNVTKVISNAPGVLIRGASSLSAKVLKLQEVFPSANMTRMVSRTPAIMYLDIDRTVRPKAEWIKQAVGLDQHGLDRLVEAGPWLLKSGWGPLARLEFAIEAGIARVDRPSTVFSLVRRSRVAFAKAHHPAYADFLRKRLQEEAVEEGSFAGEGREAGGVDLHPLVWRPAVAGVDGGGAAPAAPAWAAAVRHGSGVKPESSPAASSKHSGERTARLQNPGAKLENVVPASGEEGEEDNHDDEEDEVEREALRVAALEDALGCGRKSRLVGVRDPPPYPRRSSFARLQGSPKEGDAFLDLGQEMVEYDTRPQPRIGP